MKASLCTGLLLVAVSSAAIYERYTTHLPDPIDPEHTHCEDVKVDNSTEKAQEWLSAHLYEYTSWTTGLCDESVYPTIEHVEHPSNLASVTIRKLGHDKPAVLMAEAPAKSVDCRTNTSAAPLSISITNGNNKTLKIRGCQDQYACKPYKDCDVALAPSATETVTFDISFKYFVFTVHGEGQDSELYPDANLHYPTACTVGYPPAKPKCTDVMMLAEEAATDSDIIVYKVTPGNQAHCTEMFFMGGKSNEYYKAHGYQYDDWTSGKCPAKYNWFNKNMTIAKGVVEEVRGVHS